MKEDIIRLREELVELSSDQFKTRELLDKLTEEEIEQYRIESVVHVGKEDIEDERDFDFYKVCKTRDGYTIHYKGGYTVVVDERNTSACGGLALLMDDEEFLDENEKEAMELTKGAIEMAFRLPLFSFSHAPTLFNIATIATQYLVYLQEKGEVPTEETDNPEYDKFIQQMNELMENFASGLEKEGLEWERRNGYVSENGQIEGEGQGEGESVETEAPSA